jgi:hypothetical protein
MRLNHMIDTHLRYGPGERTDKDVPSGIGNHDVTCGSERGPTAPRSPGELVDADERYHARVAALMGWAKAMVSAVDRQEWLAVERIRREWP